MNNYISVDKPQLSQFIDITDVFLNFIIYNSAQKFRCIWGFHNIVFIFIKMLLEQKSKARKRNMMNY